MADQSVGIDTLVRGIANLNTLDIQVGGDDQATWVAPSGEQGMSFNRAIKTMFQAGGLPAMPFATKALMTASALIDGKYAQVTDDSVAANNGLYVKTAGVWVKSAYDTAQVMSDYIENGFWKDEATLVTAKKSNHYIRSDTGLVEYTVNTPRWQTYAVNVSKDTTLRIITDDAAEAFRWALVEGVFLDDSSMTPTSVLVLDPIEVKETAVRVKEGQTLVVYLGGSASMETELNVRPNIRTPKIPLYAEALSKPLGAEGLEDNSVTAAKTTFIREEKVELVGKLRRDVAIYKLPDEPATFYNAGSAWAYEYDVEQGAVLEINVSGLGHNRFRVAGAKTDTLTEGSTLVAEIYNDGGENSVRYVNNSGINKLLVQVNTATTAATIEEVPDVTLNKLTIAGLVLDSTVIDTGTATEVSYAATFGKVANNVKGTLGTVEYPRLAAIKYEYRKESLPEPVVYLYSTRDSQEFLYAESTPENMRKLCDWNKVITWNGARKIDEYNQFITDDGDIVCVARGDMVSGDMGEPTARQNPIIYPAGDYANPVVVDFGDRIKPTNWLLSTGISQVPEEDCFMFSEYTRPVHEKTHIWRVTKPYTNPDNWQIVQEFTLSRPDTVGEHREGNLKHMHTMSYDPWSGMLVSSTGDYNDGAKILVSHDKGLNWSIAAENDEQKCRVLNVSFDEEGAWWASDSHGAKHVFIHCPRAEDGSVDLSFDNMEILDTFENSDANAATYGTVRLTRPNGFLFLDRQDSVTTTADMSVNFYSLEHQKMFVVAYIEKSKEDGYSGSEAVGFRSDAVALYQAGHYDKIAVGFHSSIGRNANAVAGNEIYNRVDNLLISVDRV